MNKLQFCMTVFLSADPLKVPRGEVLFNTQAFRVPCSVERVVLRDVLQPNIDRWRNKIQLATVTLNDDGRMALEDKLTLRYLLLLQSQPIVVAA